MNDIAYFLRGVIHDLPDIGTNRTRQAPIGTKSSESSSEGVLIVIFGGARKLAMVCITSLAIAGCSSDADVASRNLSQSADMFEINRRVVFYNGITGEYILSIEGLCSLGNNDTAKRMSVTCKTGAGAFKKHFLGLSDNVTFFAEQIEPAKVGTYHYRVIFKPQAIIPDIDFRTKIGG